MKKLDMFFQDKIGRRGIVEGHEVELVEWLQHESRVILQEVEEQQAFQENQYGRISRRDHQNWSIHILNEAKTAPHPVLAILLDGIEQQQLITLWRQQG